MILQQIFSTKVFVPYFWGIQTIFCTAKRWEHALLKSKYMIIYMYVYMYPVHVFSSISLFTWKTYLLVAESKENYILPRPSIHEDTVVQKQFCITLWHLNSTQSKNELELEIFISERKFYLETGVTTCQAPDSVSLIHFAQLTQLLVCLIRCYSCILFLMWNFFKKNQNNSIINIIEFLKSIFIFFNKHFPLLIDISSTTDPFCRKSGKS